MFFLADVGVASFANDIRFVGTSFPVKYISCGIPAIDSPRIPPDCIILANRVFEKFTLADEPFAKALQIFETCVLVTNNLCRKLVSSLELPIKLDERFKVI